MLRNFLFLSLFIVLNLSVAFGQTTSGKRPTAVPDGLTCDFLSSGPGHEIASGVQILNRHPAFAWMLRDARRGIRQKAWQIILADDPALIDAGKGDNRASGRENVWTSGKVTGSQSSGIVYDGPPLKPGHSYYWKVKVWNNLGEVSPYSVAAGFRTAAELADYATEKYSLVRSAQPAVGFEQQGALIKADFGKDAFGQLRLRLLANTDHDTVQIRLGELLRPDGAINRKPPGTIRYAAYTLPLRRGLHTYDLKIRQDKRNTGPDAIKMPAYIGEVTPFRYCELEGYRHPLKKDQLTRLAVNYPFNDLAAEFHSSDTVLNQVWDLCKYSVKATSFTGVYIDGDRERIPYEADAYINQLSHYAVDREYALARYSHEYLINKPTWPTEWILQSVLIAWNDYLYTGDIRSARHFYDDLVAKTLMPLQDSNGLITVKKVTPRVLQDIHFNASRPLEDIVDWPHTGILGLNKNEGGEADGFVFTDYSAVTNAYFYKALLIMKALALDLGKPEDALMFQHRAQMVKDAFHRLLWDDQRGVYCDGVTTRHASLHSNFFALRFGLVDDSNIKTVLSFIESRGMACSVYGSQFLMDALYDNGGEDYGLQLLTARNDRSWYNMIRAGSTITLEAWDNKYKPNQDWNHVWGSAPANIISRKLMGIEPLSPGWATFKIAPRPGNLTHAQITVPTIRGTISMSFRRDPRRFELKTRIPANTTADIYLPVNSGGITKVLMDGAPVKAVKDGQAVYIKNVGSGAHGFLVEYMSH